jgi:hypothetical protein
MIPNWIAPDLRNQIRAKHERLLPLKMAHTMDFIGQRADRAIVTDILVGDEVDAENTVVRDDGVVKEVEVYTVSCDECGGDGYYDQLGEIICEGCGMVLSGDRDPVIPTEYNADADDSVGSSRGLEKMGGHRGSHLPRV